MDSAELIKSCRAIRLDEKEEKRVSFKNKMKAKDKKIVASCMVGKVLHIRRVSIEGLKTIIQRVWKTSREVKMESLSHNVFMFKFGYEADKRSIMVGGPWHFDKALIVLTEPTGIKDVKKQDFSHVSFCLQIHDVPTTYMTKEMATKLGEVIRKVKEVKTNVTGEYFEQFLRLRIIANVTKLLKKIIELEYKGKIKRASPCM